MAILNKGLSKEKIITIERLKDALMITSPLWETFNLQEKRRIFKLIIKGIDYDSKDEILGVTLNENGLKFLCTNIDFNKNDK